MLVGGIIAVFGWACKAGFSRRFRLSATLPLGAGVAVPEGAPQSGEAEPAPRGRRFQGSDGGYCAEAATCRRRSSANASLGVRQLRHLSGRSLSR